MTLSFPSGLPGSPNPTRSSTRSTRTRPRSSVRNTFDAIVDDLVQLDGRVRVGLAGAVPLTSEITVAARESLDLRPGDVVFASVKATDIDVEPA